MYGFKCPNCACTRLEEILDNAVVGNFVYGVDTEEVHYHEVIEGSVNTTIIYDGEVVRYQCNNCGFVLPNVTDSTSLYEYLKQEHEKDDEEIDD